MKTASREKRTSAGSAAGFEPDINILKVLKYDNQNNLPGGFHHQIRQDPIRQRK